MFYRILNIAWKDLLHLWHNRLLLILVIFGGAAELTLVGIATGAEINDLRVVVIDHDQSDASSELIARLQASPVLRLDEDSAETFRNFDSAKRERALDAIFTGGFFGTNPVMLVEIPSGLDTQLMANAHPTVHLTLNGASSLVSTIARRAAETAIDQFGLGVIEKQLSAQGSLSPQYELVMARQTPFTMPAITVKYNEDLRRADYTTPSETAFVLGIITLMIAAVLLAREREYGTFEQLLVMPMRPIEIIFGKALPAILLGMANFLLLLGLMRVGFRIPFRGSLPLLLILATGYLFVELGRGFLIAMISRTQNQALLLVMLVAFVDITFSGYAVPVETMPEVMQSIANLFPIRHWMIILRGIMQKDVGLAVLWRQIAWLIVLGTAINVFTLWFFRRSLGKQR